jgi:hypothetical protein
MTSASEGKTDGIPALVCDEDPQLDEVGTGHSDSLRWHDSGTSGSRPTTELPDVWTRRDSAGKRVKLFCRHRWGRVDFAFNPPVDLGGKKGVKYATHEELMEIIYGFTVVTQQCEECGLARSYREAGRTQA